MEAYISGGFWCVFDACSSFVCLSDQVAGDGGAYPECHVAQYPLGMGTKKVCDTILR